MKLFIKYHIIILLSFFLLSCQSSSSKRTKISDQVTNTIIESVQLSFPLHIELEQKYPQKNINLQDIAQIEYIPLETNDDVLLESALQLVYVGDDYYVICNQKQGDVFFFEKDGKFRHKFNNKGNSGKEYNSVASCTFDELNREIFIVDYLERRRILVYTEEGQYLRTLPFPSMEYLCDIYDFDEQTLLAYYPVRFRQETILDMKDKGIDSQKPYVFISKQDGRLLDRVDITFSKRISPTLLISTDPFRFMSISNSASNNAYKLGREFIIADMSSDTIYTLNNKRQLSPLLIRSPSVFDSEPFLISAFGMKTDHFIYIYTMAYDFKLAEESVKNGTAFSPKITDFLYDLRTGEVCEPYFINQDYPSRNNSIEIGRAYIKSENTSVQLRFSERLVEALEKGELKGKLKEVAETLRVDDNPVLMVMRFK